MAHKETLGTDSEGRFRRYLGYKFNGQKLIQHLFRLGRDEQAARLANSRLEALWNALVARWRRRKAQGLPAEPGPLWDDFTLHLASAIAKGATHVTVRPPPGLETPAEVVGWLAAVQVELPVIPLRLPETALSPLTECLNEERKELDRQERLNTVLSKAIGQTPKGQTLHEALDAYAKHIAKTYQGMPSNRPQQAAIALLKKHTPDAGLDRLDADRIEELLAYWCRRPQGHNSRPLARVTVRNTLIVFRQFLRWLDRSTAFAWDMPRNFTFPRCKIDDTPADRVRKRRVFKIEELKVIWAYAKPWERALILLALNCGFSKAEIATLQPAEVVEEGTRTFIKRHRVKTGVYAEWVLWPETLPALDYLRQFTPQDSTYLVTSRAGTPLTKQTRTGNENQVIKNHWDRLFDRIKAEHPDFHKLPFKHLRKTGATMIRKLSRAELASMYLSHGEESDHADQLLADYADRPWKKLHKALLKLRRVLLPVLTSVEAPWEYKMNTISPKVRKRVVALCRQGLGYKEVAQEVGLHHVTVGKVCRAAGLRGRRKVGHD